VALNVIEASPELKANLQSKPGTSRLQLLLQFAGSNGDAVKDRITFTNPGLILTYTTLLQAKSRKLRGSGILFIVFAVHPTPPPMACPDGGRLGP
jgi:hypothetical protein